MNEPVIIGNATLYLGDCREILPTLPKVDAVVTDPPYGIGADKGKQGAPTFNGGKAYQRAYYPDNDWDNARPDEQTLQAIIRSGTIAIVWGGNYFADCFPPQGKWLWWDKCQTMPTFGDGELAWTNLPGSTPKKFVLANNKLFADRVVRHHPTQKPPQLMMWCIEQIPAPAHTILDPYMGSGTTGVACAQMGRSFIGIEIDPRYFDIACRRIEAAQAQPDLFIQPAPSARPMQNLLFEAA